MGVKANLAPTWGPSAIAPEDDDAPPPPSCKGTPVASLEGRTSLSIDKLRNEGLQLTWSNDHLNRKLRTLNF
jgi:hypothetical protein